MKKDKTTVTTENYYTYDQKSIEDLLITHISTTSRGEWHFDFDFDARGEVVVKISHKITQNFNEEK